MKIFQYLVFTCLFTALAITGLAQTVTTPRPVSPAAEITQRIGLTDVTVNYSRPRVTINGVDRTGQIWGTQIPFGLQKINFAGQGEIPWRAGANENTTIEFTHDVKIEGKSLAAGKYSLHMIINKDDTAIVIFNKTTTSWGSFWYDSKDDVLRVTVPMKSIPHTEVLTYSFPDMGNDYAVLALDWEKKRVAFKIDVDVQNIVLGNIRNELRNLAGFSWQGFQSAAQFCINNNINNDECIGWATQAVALNSNVQTLTTQSNLLYQGGKEAESNTIVDQIVKISNRIQINALGYQLLGVNRFKKAIEVLTLNTVSDPTDANAFDSLGEAYKLAGDKPNAVTNLRKALSLNPVANVKANSEKLLRELGENVQ